MTDFAKLRALAEKATPGPWFENQEYVQVCPPNIARNADICFVSSVNINAVANRAYIAAASPSAWLAMAKRCEELESALKPTLNKKTRTILQELFEAEYACGSRRIAEALAIVLNREERICAALKEAE